MMSYTYECPKNIHMYRSAHDITKLKNGRWFIFNKEDTFGYGNITGEFKPKRDLKLINITHPDFYTSLISVLNEYTLKSDDIEKYKLHILFPLGFPDIDVYRQFAKRIGLTVFYPPCREDVESASQLFGGRSRCSVHDIDSIFLKFIQSIYNTYDGLISPIKLPNKISNGLHHSELCIFDLNNVEFIRLIDRTSGGGHIKNMNNDTPAMIIASNHTNPEIKRALKAITNFAKKMDKKNKTRKNYKKI